MPIQHFHILRDRCVSSFVKGGGHLQRMFSAPAAARDVARSPQGEDAALGHAPSGSKQPPHLIVLVNGLWGTPDNWSAICEALRETLDPNDVLLHPSIANQLFATYDGIDVCGRRLAEEIRAVVARNRGLTRLTVIGHSMGGLLARYALGVLYEPRSATICGLLPCHFVTLATPHMGCDAEGLAQVPFIGWSGSLPLLGVHVQRLLQRVSAPTAATLFGRTGEHFFLADAPTGTASAVSTSAITVLTNLDRGSRHHDSSSPSNPPSYTPHATSDADTHRRQPLLLQMTQDAPARRLYFYSALASFATRTCYANTDGDHLVGWANSSLRSLGQLPHLPATHASARGVVLEDPMHAAFHPQAWKRLAAAGAVTADGCGDASNGGGSERIGGRTSSLQRVVEVQEKASGSVDWVDAGEQRATATAAGSGSNGGGATTHAPEAPQLPPAELQPAEAAHQPRRPPLDAQAQDDSVAAVRPGAIGAVGAQDLPHSEGVSGAAAAGSVGVAYTSQDLERSSSSSSIISDAEEDLAAGLNATAAAAPHSPRADGDQSRSGGTASASGAAGSDDVAVAAGCSARALQVEQMLQRLQQLPWRRIDVSFRGATFGFSHNNLQVTRRWQNFQGIAAIQHLARQVAAMDGLVTAGLMNRQVVHADNS